MLAATIVNHTIKTLTSLVCRIVTQALAQVPRKGPLIIISNHINFLEVPLLYTHLQPRPLTGFAKMETWDNPALARLFDLWGAIPLQRGQADLRAIRRGLAALEQGKILGMAPEGTRSGDGRLRSAHAGVVMLALHSGVPVLPLAYFGGERLRHNLARLRRTDFHIVVGQPFTLRYPGERPGRAERQQMLDEMMYQLAALLPPAYRGHYADLGRASEDYLVFEAPAKSNLGEVRRKT
jgi:1-acyl-sn-glycerol-3-phosphate acyltransferase